MQESPIRKVDTNPLAFGASMHAVIFLDTEHGEGWATVQQPQTENNKTAHA